MCTSFLPLKVVINRSWSTLCFSAFPVLRQTTFSQYATAVKDVACSGKRLVPGAAIGRSLTFLAEKNGCCCPLTVWQLVSLDEVSIYIAWGRIKELKNIYIMRVYVCMKNDTYDNNKIWKTLGVGGIHATVCVMTARDKLGGTMHLVNCCCLNADPSRLLQE